MDLVDRTVPTDCKEDVAIWPNEKKISSIQHICDGCKLGKKVHNPCLALPLGKRSGVGGSPVPEYSCIPGSQPSGMAWSLPNMPK